MKGQHFTAQRWIISAATSALLLFSAASHAVTIEVMTAAWDNPLPIGTSNLSINNVGDTAEISWGNVAAGENSAYFVEGTGPQMFDLPTEPGEMTDFIQIATFTHRNRVITGNFLESVELDLGISLINGDIFDDVFTFLFSHDETNNAAPCDAGPSGPSVSVCDDFISITEPEPQQFMFAGMLFDIDLTFFLADGVTPSDQVQTQEDNENVRILAVKITKLSVPEPATLGMLGLGLLFLAGVSRKSFSGSRS